MAIYWLASGLHNARIINFYRIAAMLARRQWFTLFLLLLTTAAAAAQNIQVLGLFKDKAMLSIDGVQRVLKVGESSADGVKLIAADSEQAVLEIDGKRIVHSLGVQSGGIAPPALPTLRIWPDSNGMFITGGSVNGAPVRFLIDTGATLVAMNAAQARKLNIDFRSTGNTVIVTTASGVKPGYLVKLNRVKVGAIEAHFVDAVVLEGAHPELMLLGISFLNRVNMSHEGQSLTLKQRY